MFFFIRVYFVLSILFLRLICVSYLWLCQINSNLVRVPILSYLGVCVWQFHRVCFLFSLKVSWYQISDFRFLIVILNFLIESWFFLKSKVESGFWLNIIHVWLCLASCFVFSFFCASNYPFLIWYAHIVKKKGFTQSLPHRNVTVSRPNLPKKKLSKKNQFRCVHYYSCLFLIEYSFLASRLCFVFVIVSD